MADEVRPTLARRQLGRILRRLRLETGKTHADVKTAGIGGRSKMSLMEAGRAPVRLPDIRALILLYEVGQEQAAKLIALAEATQRTGMHEALDASMPERFGTYGELVDAASLLRIHSAELIHGLLQTEDYARAVIAADDELTPDEVEQRVAFRLRRQATYLRRPEPGRLEAVITAGTLTNAVASDEIMHAAIDHLREVNTAAGVSIRVLPAKGSVYAPVSGTFMLFEFDDPEDPPLVYVPTIVDARYFERQDYLEEYRRVFNKVTNLSVPLEEYHP